MIKEIISWLLKGWMLAIVVVLVIIVDQVKRDERLVFYRKLHTECKLITDSFVRGDEYTEWLCPGGVTHRVNK